MAEHKLAPGRNLISALSALGEALGYHVAREHPVEVDRKKSPAVDIAWFAEPGQAYPLMIFEVESRATNSLANNATKVFGQPSNRFEKPLFFFHIVLRSADTSRLATLERLFGTYNYRSFNLSETSIVTVLEAALAQHRRIRRTVALAPLRDCFDLDGWHGVTPRDLVRILCTLNFAADYEPSMSIHALRGEHDLEAFVDWLIDHGGLEESSQAAGSTYQTYLGWWAAHPLHLGVVAAERPALAAEMADRFRSWQAPKDRDLSQLGPYFGLSRDYDEFLIGGAPALCATVGALVPTLTPELLELMASLRSALADWAGAPNAIWALHLASAIGNDAAFEAAREHLNDMGGVRESMLLLPEALYSTSGDETWPEELMDDRTLVPTSSVFVEKVRGAIPAGTKPSAVRAALRLLADDRYGFDPPLALIAALAMT